MTEKSLRDLLAGKPIETECLEFKEAKNSFEVDKLGHYFSALSNEANIKRQPYALLIFGIENKTCKIVGTKFRTDKAHLQCLKQEVAQHTTGNISLEIREHLLPEGRVLVFKIPPALRGIPTAWNGHYFARNGESLVALTLAKLEQIRLQAIQDWSANVVHNACVSDLDPAALAYAKKQYVTKNPKYAEDVKSWSVETFLNKAKLTIQGKITNTAILLLGKPEAEHYISPAIAKISWILKNSQGVEVDYAHFGTPFLTNVENVFSKLRNLTFRYIPNKTLFPTEIPKYDPWIIREALHNCIAHQDYALGGKITLVECPNQLIFTNSGTFIPGDAETVISQDSPPSIYRNKYLADAMVNLNMIDTVGSGIRKMFITQKERFFPLPNYNLDENQKVILKIDGEIIDENYTRLLMEKKDLSLEQVILLDKVQRKIGISKERHKLLKALNLVEGRYPNIFVSAKIASATGEKAKYIRNRAFDKEYYQDMILGFLSVHKTATRKDFDDLLIEKLPDVLNMAQKRRKINNILTEMSQRMRVIRNSGSSRSPIWVSLRKLKRK